MSRSYGLLSEIRMFCNSAPHALRIEGHTDLRGTSSAIELVTEVLIQFVFIWWTGVDVARLEAVIRSEQPIETNKNAPAREEPARRVRHHAAVRQIQQIEKER